jgi:hypothetical protein
MQHRLSNRPMLALFLLAVVSACGGQTIQVNGIEVYEKHWNKTLEELRPRVAFDMNCPADQAEFVLFKRVGRVPSEVGVQGCGKRGMYVRSVVGSMRGPWVLNVGSETEEPVPQAPATTGA